MKHRGMKILSLLLTLALVLGLMPGMSLTAYADDAPPYAQYKNTTTVIKFDEKDWYLIDYDDTTVTLLAKECVTSSKYNSSGSFVEYSNNPTVKTAVDNWYDGNISTDAKKAVSGNAMFLLTKDQANAITNADVRKCSGGSWWLCSQGLDVSMAALVYGGSGAVDEDGEAVSVSLGVRPALELDLSSVIFESTSNRFSLKPAGYTVHFDANDGSGQMKDVPNVSGEYTLPGCDFDPPEGQSFKAWRMDGTSNEFAPGAKINIGSNTTFVAVWQAAASGGAVGFGGGDGYSGGYVAPQRTYRVSLAPMQGGSAALVLNTGESGETMNVYPQTTVRVVPSPAPGYKLASIVWSLIDGSASYDITQSQNFVMPAMDAVVHVTFVPVG